MSKISPDLPMAKILSNWPETIPVFLENGMHCVGCPMSQMETLEEGCMAHGRTEEEITKLVENINKIE